MLVAPGCPFTPRSGVLSSPVRLNYGGAAAAVARSVRGPERGEPAAFGSRHDVVGGKRVDRVVPAARLAADVTGRVGADQCGSGLMVAGGIRAVAFPQSDARMIPPASASTTPSSTRSSSTPDDPDLKRHIHAAVARHGRRGWRLERPDRSTNMRHRIGAGNRPRASACVRAERTPTVASPLRGRHVGLHCLAAAARRMEALPRARTRDWQRRPFCHDRAHAAARQALPMKTRLTPDSARAGG